MVSSFLSCDSGEKRIIFHRRLSRSCITASFPKLQCPYYGEKNIFSKQKKNFTNFEILYTMQARRCSHSSVGLERGPAKVEVAGSSPAGCTI